MNKKLILIAVIVISAILAIYGYIVLPETVVIQIDNNGNPSNIVPKVLAVGFFALFSTGSCLAWYFLKKIKYLMLSGLGIILSVVTILVNR